MITRRSFIKQSAYSAAAILASDIFFPSFNSIQQLLADDKIYNGKSILSEEKKRILQNGSLAPSGHNTQPWNIKIVSDNEWIIGWDKTRSLPAVDPRNRELLLSIGAFCEALSISARNEGFEISKKIIGTSSFSDELVKVNFKASEKSGQLINALKKRRTVKNGFSAAALRADDLTYIFSGINSKAYQFSRGSSEAGFIEAAVLESNKIQAGRDDAQEELASWIRWKDEDSKKYRNGLTPDGMEISGIGGWYVKHFYGRDDVMTESFRKQTVSMVEKFLSSYGSWILITAGKENPESLINTGGDFLRLGLNAFNRSIALHPMTQPLEEKGFAEVLRKNLGIKEKIQFILRAGYIENYPDPVSMRMPVESIII